MCNYLVQESKPCRHRDMYGRCIWGGCGVKRAPCSLRVVVQCIVVNTLHFWAWWIKSSFCESCISEWMKQKYFPLLDIIGKKQYTPSKWMFSRYVVNAFLYCIIECRTDLFKIYSKAGNNSISKGGSMHDYK